MELLMKKMEDQTSRKIERPSNSKPQDVSLKQSKGARFRKKLQRSSPHSTMGNHDKAD